MKTYEYIVEFFDKDGIRPNKSFVIDNCPNKNTAIALGRGMLLENAKATGERLTDGMSHHTFDVTRTDKNGREYTFACKVSNVAPDYATFNYLHNWGIAFAGRRTDVNSGVSSEKAIAKADRKLADNWQDTSEKQGDSSVTRRKKHWTAAEKKAAAARRAAVKAARAAKRAAQQQGKADLHLAA